MSGRAQAVLRVMAPLHAALWAQQEAPVSMPTPKIVNQHGGIRQLAPSQGPFFGVALLQKRMPSAEQQAVRKLHMQIIQANLLVHEL